MMRLVPHPDTVLVVDEDGGEVELLAGDDKDLLEAALRTDRTVAVAPGLLPSQLPMAARRLVGLLDEVRANGVWAPADASEIAEELERRALGQARNELRRRNLTPLLATVTCHDPMASPPSERILVLALAEGIQDGCRLRVRLERDQDGGGPKDINASPPNQATAQEQPDR